MKNITRSIYVTINTGNDCMTVLKSTQKDN